MLLAGVFGMVLAFSLGSCTTMSSVGGTADSHGFFTMSSTAGSGSEEIATYGIVLGLFDVGYTGYARAVREADSAGKTIASVTKTYLGFYTKVTAYAK